MSLIRICRVQTFPSKVVVVRTGLIGRVTFIFAKFEHTREFVVIFILIQNINISGLYSAAKCMLKDAIHAFSAQ